MISLYSLVYRDIDRRIAKEIEERSAQLAAGQAQSFDDYRFRVGYLKALSDARIWARSVNDKLVGREEEKT